MPGLFLAPITSYGDILSLATVRNPYDVCPALQLLSSAFTGTLSCQLFPVLQQTWSLAWSARIATRLACWRVFHRIISCHTFPDLGWPRGFVRLHAGSKLSRVSPVCGDGVAGAIPLLALLRGLGTFLAPLPRLECLTLRVPLISLLTCSVHHAEGVEGGGLGAQDVAGERNGPVAGLAQEGVLVR